MAEIDCPARDHTKRPTLLLAEDDTRVATAFMRVLGEHFDIVDVVSDGATLVERAHQLVPDAIVADVCLAGLDGISATIEILRQHPAIRIVLMTGHSDPAIRFRALAAGASAFLLKIEAAEVLLTVLRRCLGEG